MKQLLSAFLLLLVPSDTLATPITRVYEVAGGHISHIIGSSVESPALVLGRHRFVELITYDDLRASFRIIDDQGLSQIGTLFGELDGPEAASFFTAQPRPWIAACAIDRVDAFYQLSILDGLLQLSGSIEMHPLCPTFPDRYTHSDVIANLVSAPLDAIPEPGSRVLFAAGLAVVWRRAFGAA